MPLDPKTVRTIVYYRKVSCILKKTTKEERDRMQNSRKRKLRHWMMLLSCWQIDIYLLVFFM